MRVRLAKSFTAIACCTFCGARNILAPPLNVGSNCVVCHQPLEFFPEIDCPHCSSESITIAIGRQANYGSYLKCSVCSRQIADGIPVQPQQADVWTWLSRKAVEFIGQMIATMLQRPIPYGYQPKLSEVQFDTLRASWVLESRTRESERQGQPRPNENDSRIYAQLKNDTMLAHSRQAVQARHSALLDKYDRHITALMALANGKIYQDEYGDEIWDNAEREIDRVIDGKLFKGENIRDRDEFYSFEFLSRCEPAFSAEYSDCWIYDELCSRLRSYHRARIEALQTGKDVDIDGLSGIEFEEWLIATIKRAGVVNTTPTRRTGDQGADIIVRHDRTIIIQAKCYQQNVGNDAVQQAHAAKTHYGGDEAWVVTNSRFTRAARELAASTGVVLVDQSAVRDIGTLVAGAIGRNGLAMERRDAEDLAASSRTVQSIRTNVVTAVTPEPNPPTDRPSPIDDTSSETAWSATIAPMHRRNTPPKRGLYIAIGTCAVVVMIATCIVSTNASHVGAEKGVRDTLATWTRTMRDNDLAGQVDCYAPSVEPFFQHPKVSIQVVADEKRKLMNAYPVVKQYAISDINFEKIQSDFVQLSFDKTWEVRGSQRFVGREREMLKLRPIGGTWKIVAETERKIYWVQTK